MADLSKIPAEVLPVEIIKPGLAGSDRHSGPEIIEAEWVRRYPSRRVWQWWRWFNFGVRILIAAGLTWLFLVIPPTTFPDSFQNWKNPVVIGLLVCFIGKTLLDTLFYDHYQP